MAKIKLDGYRCERCQHEWFPRETTTGEPTICPDCKSPYWNRRRIDTTKRKAISRYFKTKAKRKYNVNK